MGESTPAPREPLTEEKDLEGAPWKMDGAGLVRTLVGDEDRRLHQAAGSNSKIQKIVDEAPDGATITIPPGTYRHGFVVDGRSDLTIRAEPGTVWVIEQSAEVTVAEIKNSERITIEGLGLLHEPEGSCKGDALRIRRSHDITVQNNDLSGSGVAGVRATDVANLLIRQNHIHNSTAHAVALWDVANVELSGNLIRENQWSTDWNLRQGAALWRVYGEVLVTGNLFVENPSIPVSIRLPTETESQPAGIPDTHIKIRNNVFTANTPAEGTTINVQTMRDGEELEDIHGRLEIRNNCFERSEHRPDTDAHVAWSSEREGNIIADIEVDDGYAISAPDGCSLQVSLPARWADEFADKPHLREPARN